MTRKLARIAQITSIRPIPDADAIECAVVDDGWEVVVRKGEYAPGEVAIYLEVDSWVPHELAPFLSKGHEPREYNGVKGERLKTVRLRGQISQGLLLKLSDIPLNVYAVVNEATSEPYRVDEIQWGLGQDLTLELNIQKWEAPIPAQLAGNVEGGFPSFVPKTDQERCQNLFKEIFVEKPNEIYEVTEKLEGSSMTIYRKDGEIGVCSRNWNLKEDYSNSFWEAARDCGLVDFLRNEYHGNIAIQGELIGEGVQGNYYGIKGREFHVYDVYDIDKKEYWSPTLRYGFINSLPLPRLHHVPIVSVYETEVGKMDMAKLLAMAEGQSTLNPKKKREGLVFKSQITPFHFKVVSNSYLLKTGG